MMKKIITVGIDASRNRSGGAKAHLIGLITHDDPRKYGISKVHLWSYKSLLESIPNQPWLVKHQAKALDGSIFHQILWQIFQFPKEAKKAFCDIVLNTDAGTLSNHKPCITMSRDMLSYEPGEIERYGYSKARLRLFLLRYIQNRSLRNSDAVIFLTKYASLLIQKSCGSLKRTALIPHGVGENFRSITHNLPWPIEGDRPIRLLYISNAALYKHQWIIIRAAELLRKQSIPVTLTLVGGGRGVAQRKLLNQLEKSDPHSQFVTQCEFVPQSELPSYLANADIFVFASSCENMPNTLIEAMAVGLPIACSSRGPMPEILRGAGVYFDPEDAASVVKAIKKIYHEPKLRQQIGVEAKHLAQQYSWERCARQTWKYLFDTYNNITNT